MSDLTITLPDGSSRILPEGSTGLDLAAHIGPGLAKAAVIVSVDGEGRALNRALADGDSVSVVTADSDEGLYTLRHSTAHVLAQAVLDLWPGATHAIGPPIEHERRGNPARSRRRVDSVVHESLHDHDQARHAVHACQAQDDQ